MQFLDIIYKRGQYPFYSFADQKWKVLVPMDFCFAIALGNNGDGAGYCDWFQQLTCELWGNTRHLTANSN